MDYIFSSSNNEPMLLPSHNESNRENLDSNHEEDVPFFGQFRSHLLDEILHNHHQQHMPTTTTANKPPPPSPPKTKRVRKQRSAGKKDRHSKIHTAQGLRDRRMRLSLHIARKFFGLQDMLGFDKASKTIEWLFCKSKKAIDEVTQNFKSQSPCRENIESCESPLSDCEVDSGNELDHAASNKGKQFEINNDSGSSQNHMLAKELRSRARARARERTRERMLINDPEKSKQLFGSNPNDDFDQQQLGFSTNPNNHSSSSPNDHQQLGFSTNPNNHSSTSPNEYCGTHHFFDPTQINNIVQKTEDYLGTDVASSSTYFSGYGIKQNIVNPPAGWLNSSNTFLGFFGGWESENFTGNNGLLSTLAPFAGDIQGQNFSSLLIPPSNLLHFQTQNQRD
ncbi:hypothetical protein SSX86_007072 [Deinandra increscens subsp. villosa]|uniref:Uncharacterized protein n=1 Tax=Deinandra increscens subsp. villosa TaxID=3103831 RepID=A0AAP0H676_9ASTR